MSTPRVIRPDHCDYPLGLPTLRAIQRALVATLCALPAAAAIAQDATQTDADKYKVVLENDCVRVLDYRDQPGERTHQHRHPAFVLYALGPFKRKLTLPDGRVLMREFNRGDVMWSDAQTHIGENVGATPTQVLIVELKKSPADSGVCPRG